MVIAKVPFLLTHCHYDTISILCDRTLLYKIRQNLIGKHITVLYISKKDQSIVRLGGSHGRSIFITLTEAVNHLKLVNDFHAFCLYIQDNNLASFCRRLSRFWTLTSSFGGVY